MSASELGERDLQLAPAPGGCVAQASPPAAIAVVEASCDFRSLAPDERRRAWGAQGLDCCPAPARLPDLDPSAGGERREPLGDGREHRVDLLLADHQRRLDAQQAAEVAAHADEQVVLEAVLAPVSYTHLRAHETG